MSGAALDGADMCGANLASTEWSREFARPGVHAPQGAHRLFGAVLRDTDLAGFSLMGADLTDADLTGADLRRTDLRGACLFRARLSQALLAGAGLRAADLTEADFSGADLARADLTGADATGALFAGADLRGAAFDDLTGARLGGVMLDDFNRGATHLRDESRDGPGPAGRRPARAPC